VTSGGEAAAWAAESVYAMWSVSPSRRPLDCAAGVENSIGFDRIQDLRARIAGAPPADNHPTTGLLEPNGAVVDRWDGLPILRR